MTSPTPTRGRGRPSIPSILAPTLDSDGIAAYEVTGKIPMNDDRIGRIVAGLDELRPQHDHDAVVEQHGGKTYVVVNDDTTLAAP